MAAVAAAAVAPPPFGSRRTNYRNVPGIRDEVAQYCDWLISSSSTTSTANDNNTQRQQQRHDVVDISLVRYIASSNHVELAALAAALQVTTKLSGRLSLYWTFNNNAANNASSPLLLRGLVESVLPYHPSLTELDLRGNRLNDEHAMWIGNALVENSSLKVIWLHHNKFTARGMRSLSKGLCQNSTLEELYLSSNPNIGVEGCIALASALEHKQQQQQQPKPSSCCQLNVLALSDCRIGNDGAKAISRGLAQNQTLSILYLSDNGIGDDGCCSIANDALRHNNTLVDLDLSDNRITDVGATALGCSLEHINYALEELNLGSNRGISKKIKRNKTNNNNGQGRGGRQWQQEDQLEWIDRLCERNRQYMGRFQMISYCAQGLHQQWQHRQQEPMLLPPLNLWPHILCLVETKPDLLYAVLCERLPELLV